MARGFASGKPMYIASAKGAMIYDVEGKEYIDFGGGIAVMNVGHSSPKVIQAIKDQADKFTHTCFMVAPYEVAVKLGAKLCGVLGVVDGNGCASTGAQPCGRHARTAKADDKDAFASQIAGSLHQRTFKVRSKPTMAQKKETIQKRTTMRDSGQPFFSKWWWIGAIRKMRLLVAL